ncbi:hypothetical protein CBR_g23383 [Chara braunii]|uniref:Uncharacterized protein n=1 Tax=Chara braunii TaxID=69332 RepID=A0A388L432_CHABU|nr:hypothetical protein CBR_g23383 [Chara braunii]|eukprot:GBG77057.1 hypothetical protein CBR_g23383 [Chara braunii]
MEKRKRETTDEESLLTPPSLIKHWTRVRGRPKGSCKKMKTSLKPFNLKSSRKSSDPTKKGAAARTGRGSRAKFVEDTRLYLDGMDYKVIQKMCKSESILYVRKSQAVAAVAEKRAMLAYDNTEDVESAEGKTKETSNATDGSDSEESEESEESTSQ